MSVLDDFVRMRLYRKRAVELEKAAEGCLPMSVQRRYLVAADHYRQIADAEERSERARAISRLVYWKKKVRSPDNGLAGGTAQNIAFRRSPISPADLMEEVVRILLKRAVKNARLQTMSSQQHERVEDQSEIRPSQKLVPVSSPQSNRATLRKISIPRRARTRARL